MRVTKNKLQIFEIGQGFYFIRIDRTSLYIIFLDVLNF